MIVFLDFDGVLHPDAVFKPARKPIELRAPGQLMMHGPILEEIIVPFDVEIVLSTSWVRSLGYKKTLQRMPKALAERVVGATWHTEMVDKTIYPYSSGRHVADPFNHLSRFQQIHQHVVRNNVEKRVAIDDLHSGSELWSEDFAQHLVKTDSEKGLGCVEKQHELRQKLEVFIRQF